jgi:hypothetical protein
MGSVEASYLPLDGCWLCERSLFSQVSVKAWFSGAFSTEGVMQGEQVSVSVQPFVCVLPEVSRLPKAAGLGVAYGRDRDAHYLG